MEKINKQRSRSRTFSDKTFTHYLVVENLDPRVYTFCFRVDGQWRTRQDLPQSETQNYEIGLKPNVIDMSNFVFARKSKITA